MKKGRVYTANAGVRRKKWPLIVAVFAPLLIFGGVLTYWSLDSRVTNTAPTANQQETTTPLEYTSVEGRYLFHGTIAWDRALERNSRGDYSYLWQNLHTFDKDKYDAWVADLECPVTTTHVPYQTQVDSLIFNCPPEFVPEASKWFDIVNLANNHTNDLGWDKFLETQRHLSEGGIQPYGSPDLSDDDNRCEVMGLPARLQKRTGGEEDTIIPVAFCAFHAVFTMPSAEHYAEVTRYSEVMPTIAFMHAGIEYVPTNNAPQATIAHALVDAGADMVIGNHAHWVQNTEVYKDKLIVYATGNFTYDQLTYEELRSASYDIKLSIPYDDTLARWIGHAKTCDAGKLNDDCFSTLPSGMPKLSATYQYDMVAGDQRAPQRWLARKAGDELQRDTESRTNWLQTLTQLGQDPNQRFYNQ